MSRLCFLLFSKWGCGLHTQNTLLSFDKFMVKKSSHNPDIYILATPQIPLMVIPVPIVLHMPGCSINERIA